MPNILITGASGGLGAALARAYAAPGVTLALWGRDQPRLDTVAAECRARGATAEVASLDLRDIDAQIAALEALDARLPLDLAIFNAGVGGTVSPHHLSERPQRAYEQATVNFTAPVVGASAIAERMAARRTGQIVLIGSVAGSFPLPMSPTYSGAKSGLELFAEALGLRLAEHGVSVTLVAPGFIDTPMSRSVPGPQPFRMAAEDAAAIIVRKVARRTARFTIPWPFGLLRRLAGLAPRWLIHTVLRGVHRKIGNHVHSEKVNGR